MIMSSLLLSCAFSKLSLELRSILLKFALAKRAKHFLCLAASNDHNPSNGSRLVNKRDTAFIDQKNTQKRGDFRYGDGSF